VGVLIVTLEKTKEWLRVESNVEDTLIEDFIKAAEDIVADVLRFPLTDFVEVPESVKHAIYFTVSKFYEERNELDIKGLIDTLKNLLYSYRTAAW
jgi:hypothetical protein